MSRSPSDYARGVATQPPETCTSPASQHLDSAVCLVGVPERSLHVHWSFRTAASRGIGLSLRLLMMFAGGLCQIPVQLATRIPSVLRRSFFATDGTRAGQNAEACKAQPARPRLELATTTLCAWPCSKRPRPGWGLAFVWCHASNGNGSLHSQTHRLSTHTRWELSGTMTPWGIQVLSGEGWPSYT
jgi:hypothetical protein